MHRKPQANLLPSKCLCGESQGRRDLFAYTGACVSENGGYFYSCLMCYHIVFAYIYCIVCMVAGGHVYLFLIACLYICLNCTYWCTEYVIFYFYSILLIMHLYCVPLRTCNYTVTRHFIRYTLLLPDSTLLTFSTTLILISSTDSTRCWQHSSDFGHTGMIASHRRAANP